VTGDWRLGTPRSGQVALNGLSTVIMEGVSDWCPVPCKEWTIYSQVGWYRELLVPKWGRKLFFVAKLL